MWEEIVLNIVPPYEYVISKAVSFGLVCSQLDPTERYIAFNLIKAMYWFEESSSMLRVLVIFYFLLIDEE